MLLSVVKRVYYDHEQSFDIMNFLNSCFKSFHIFTFNTLKYFEERKREKATKHSEDLGRNEMQEGIRAIEWEGAQRDQPILFRGIIAFKLHINA